MTGPDFQNPPPAPGAIPPPHTPIQSASPGGVIPGAPPPGGGAGKSLLSNPVVLFGGGSGLVVSLVLAILLMTRGSAKETSGQPEKKSAITELKLSCEKGDKEACETVAKLLPLKNNDKKPAVQKSVGGGKVGGGKIVSLEKKGWVKKVDEKGGYSMYFPKAPQSLVKDISAKGATLKSYWMMYEYNNQAFLSSYTNYNDAREFSLKYGPETLKSVMAGMEGAGGTLLGKAKEIPSKNGILGLEFRMSKGATTFTCRLYYKNGHLFQLMATEGHPDYVQFLNNFEVQQKLEGRTVPPVKWSTVRLKTVGLKLKMPCKPVDKKKKYRLKGMKTLEAYTCDIPSKDLGADFFIAKLKKKVSPANAVKFLKNEKMLDVKYKKGNLFLEQQVNAKGFKGLCYSFYHSNWTALTHACTFVKGRTLFKSKITGMIHPAYQKAISEFQKQMSLK
ncbi:hypothetical protein KKF84_03925 [Myxococcota bacterium]|nr:hypothetical protein [Myxococcota bacterium]